MAKPRIFISSTFYDLRYVREIIERFLNELGYEPVLFERGAVPYGNDKALEEYCYKEIQTCDVLVSIVGGRYGTTSSDFNYSITQKEIRQAYNLGKQIYIFVDKNVRAEFGTYKINKGNDTIKFKHVDNPKVYEFIEELESLPKNNTIFEFNSPQEIVLLLKEQFAGLFQRLLQQETEKVQMDIVDTLRNTVKTLQGILSAQVERMDSNNEVINNIILVNHPLLYKIKDLLKINYRIVFSNLDELDNLLVSFEFYKRSSNEPIFFTWIKKSVDPFNGFLDEEITLKISTDVFDENGKLKLDLDWDDSYMTLERKSYSHSINIDDDDLPF